MQGLKIVGAFFRPLMTGLSYFIWPRHHHPVFRFSSSSRSIPRKQRRMWAPDPERRAVPQPSPETPLGAAGATSIPPAHGPLCSA